MNIAFITKERMRYSEAPPSRILNLAKILEKYHSVHIVSRPSEIRLENHYFINLSEKNFLLNQLYKIIMVFYTICLIISKKIDIVITREYYYVVFLHPFTKLFNTKILYDMHGFRYKELKVENRDIKSFFVRLLEVPAYKFADSISVISESLYKDLPEKVKSKSFVLPNGVDLDEFKEVKTSKKVLKRYKVPEKKIVGFIGNWMEWVDVPTLLESSEYYDGDTVLLVVGKCYKDIEIKELEERYPNVVFTGRIPHDEAIQLLKAMDVCVLPYKDVEVIKHLSIRKTHEYLAAGKTIVMSDLPIGERDFLKENKNRITYKAEDAKDLASKINSLLSNKKLMKEMSKNNLELSKKFSWESQVKESSFLDVLKTYDLLGKKKIPKGKVSIIIKALNEEKYISKSIESALEALKGLDGEVILVDSKSTDKTVEIAKQYPIKILQLKNEKERCCGIGPQTGYLFSTGEFVYILDGDMKLDKDFIKKALPYFNNPKIAGVAGNIKEKTKHNLAFQVRRKHHIVNSTREVGKLGMGGLYRKKALEDVGYFSNPYFYAYEEYDLGAKLCKKDYKMLRIPHKMINHYGDETTSLKTLISRWKSRYLFGSGQYLRRSISGGHFFRALYELKIYFFTLLWGLIGIASLISLIWTEKFLFIYTLISLILLIGLFMVKSSRERAIFSLISWSFQALGMFVGFFMSAKDPKEYKPNVEKIKWTK